ncbi:hypothetical protein QYF36_008310 [Acer negundo]|nr:hypothetical protein QYF36_008310 [Acer negundo]
MRCFGALKVLSAGDLLLEYQSTRKVLSLATKPSAADSRTWLAPLLGCLKLNSDVSVKSGKDFIGIGAAIRDSSGKVVAAISKPMVGNFSVELGEFLALREGLILAKSHNLVVNYVEVDALNTASMLNSVKPFLGDAMFIISDIKALFIEVGVISCKAVPRVSNKFAHSLANLPFSSGEDLLWRDVDPLIDSKTLIYPFSKQVIDFVVRGEWRL